MFIKRKNLTVIIFSSVIVAAVLVSTLIGYSLYVQWKKDSFALKYRHSIYKLTAEIFRDEITVSNVNVKIRESGPFAGTPVLQGSLKNNSSKTVTSVLLEVAFIRSNGSVAYNKWIYPLGEYHFDGVDTFSGTAHTRKVLLPGEGISFRHFLKNCPDNIIAQLETKSSFAKNISGDKTTLVYNIKGLSLL